MQSLLLTFILNSNEYYFQTGRNIFWPKIYSSGYIIVRFFRHYATSLAISNLCFIERQIDVVCGNVLVVLPLCIALLPFHWNPKYFS